MSEEDDDYMSDKFLKGLQDVSTSLIKNRAKKRQVDIDTKHKEQIQKQKELKRQRSAVLDNESLQAALSKPLAQENIGFKLLAKMGYKPGQALGKSAVNEKSASSSNTGLIEPIGITLKTDRQGLGREAALLEINEMRRKIRQRRWNKECEAETSIEDFRRRTNQKYEDKFVLKAIRCCQVTCENLDKQCNVDKPELQWFWPESAKETIENDVNDDTDKEETLDIETEEFSGQEKLEMLTNYLRTSYLFCYWCGVRYNDEQDLKDNCPGLSKEDH